jgi:Zn-dependent peptidase ImmA (M78 family)
MVKIVREYLNLDKVVGFDELKDIVIENFKGSEITIVDNSDLIDAKIIKNNETFKIELRYVQSTNDQLFNLVHALGHLFIHMGFENKDKTLWDNADVYYDRSGIGEKWYEAAEFTNAFLMPKFDFIEQVKWYLDNETGVVNTNAIADYFNVTEQRVIIWGRKLKLFKY